MIETNNPGLKKPIALIARGGQGKTVAAKQLIDYWKATALFYSLNSEDSDAVYFIERFYRILIKNLPDYRSVFFEELINNGTMCSSDVENYAFIMVKHLQANLKDNLYLVLDDIHRLDENSETFTFIDTLIRNAGNKLKFIVLMRYTGKSSIVDNRFLVINNSALAFTKQELFEYIDTVLEMKCPSIVLNKLFSVTEGWIFGVLTRLHQLVNENQTDISIDPDSTVNISDSADEIYGFFNQEIFGHIRIEVLSALSKFSLLDEIPEHFAVELSRVPNFLNILNDYCQKNFFITLKETEDLKTYSFHLLFQDCLKKFLTENIAPQERSRFLSHAASLYLSENNWAAAIKFYLLAENYHAAQNVLKTSGIKLIDENRIITISKVLGTIPEDILYCYPWLAYFYGVVIVNTNPPAAFKYFYKAIELFRIENDAIGELLASSQTIYSHILIDGLLNKGKELLERSGYLYEKNHSDLTLHSQIHVAISIASGYICITCDFDKADKLTKRAMALANKNSFINYQAIIGKIRGFQFGFRGKWPQFNHELEQLVTVFNDPRMNKMTKLMVWLARVNLLELEGDFFNYEFLKRFIIETDAGHLIENSIFGPFLTIWDIDIAIAKGDYQLAENHIQKGLFYLAAYSNPHLKSQFLYYRSFISAINGDKELAVQAAEKSLQLRQIAGGKCFDMLCSMILCGTFANLGMKEECEFHFQRSLDITLEIDDEFVRAGAYAHRAYLYLNLGETDLAYQDINGLLSIMKRNSYVHFFSMNPDQMLPIVSFAIKNNIHPDYAAQLGATCIDKGFLQEGTVIPLLTINTLSRFSININNTSAFTAEDFSAMQQKFLSILIASPGKSIDFSHLKTELWPESKNNDSSAGVLLNRLKKVMQAVFRQHDTVFENYIVRKNNRICLINCLTDHEVFTEDVTLGMAHYYKNNYWQAENAFRKALSNKNGRLFDNFKYSDSISGLAEDVEVLYTKAAHLWSEIILIHKTIIQDDLRVLEKAISSESVQLVKNLYQLYSENDTPLRPSSIISRYKNELEKTYDDSDEVEGYINLIWGEEYLQ